MSDEFQITPYQVRSAGTDVPPEEIQRAINLLALATQNALNILATQPETPTGPAGGDLGGNYPNPTVVATHLAAALPIAQGGTGQATQTDALTALLGASLIPIANGGTNAATVAAARTNLGLGTIATQNANSVAVTGGTINNTPIGQTTTAAGAFTTLTSTGGALNGTLGATTPNTVAATTLSVSSTVSGTGFTNLFASPPALGSTTPAAVSATTLAASDVVSGTGFVNRFASPGPIGNTAASTGAFTTLSASGTITPSSTNGIVGTTTNDSANAGSVGEYVTASGSAVPLTSGTGANITSISLTAGDWDVSGVIQFLPAGTTSVTAMFAGPSTTSATNGTFDQTTVYRFSLSAGQSNVIPTPVCRFSLATTTTIFLVGAATFSVSTMTANGLIRARRVR